MLNDANGHYYELVCNGALTWDQAVAAASSSSYNSLPGHLATVTDEAEHDFLTATFGTIGTTDVWLGGSDAAVEGSWQWITGESWGAPNWGDQNWCGGEPNNDGNQDCLTYQTDASDCWDDLECEEDEEVSCYLVEYEATVPSLGSWGLAVLFAALLGSALFLLSRRPRSQNA
ncbi:MAG: C-type lectin domain-containing protein [Thermoanaerobaculia bacterium]|nr:C-type lectin domain-containing protein [Thermoanaerobaculia bacterium]